MALAVNRRRADVNERWQVAALPLAIVLALGAIEMTAMSLHSIPLGLGTPTAFTDHESAAVDYLLAHPGGSTIALTDDGVGVAYEVTGLRPNANVLAGVPSPDGYDGGVQITKRWATALQRYTADPPTELPMRNSLELPVTPEAMARLGVRYLMLDLKRDPAVFIPGMDRPARPERRRRRLGEPAVDRRCRRVADRRGDRRRRGRWPTLLRTDGARYDGIAIVDRLTAATACTDPTAAGCAPTALEVDRRSPEHLVVRADLATDSVVSVDRQALPGWSVEVDGEAGRRGDRRRTVPRCRGPRRRARDHVALQLAVARADIDRVAPCHRNDHIARPGGYRRGDRT